MSGLKVWPIVVGILIDIGGTLGASIAYFAAVAVVQATRGAAVDEATLTLGLRQLVMMGIVGLLFTATGGFVAAQMAKTRHLQHGIAVGVGSLCIGLLGELTGADATPAWFNAIAYLTTVPAAGLGGYLAARAASSRAAES
jgi:hypothetical protein